MTLQSPPEPAQRTPGLELVWSPSVFEPAPQLMDRMAIQPEPQSAPPPSQEPRASLLEPQLTQQLPAIQSTRHLPSLESLSGANLSRRCQCRADPLAATPKESSRPDPAHRGTKLQPQVHKSHHLPRANTILILPQHWVPERAFKKLLSRVLLPTQHQS